MMDSIKMNAFPSFKAKKNSAEQDEKKFTHKITNSTHKSRFADVISQGVKKIRRKNSDDQLDKSVKNKKSINDNRPKSQIQMSEGTYENSPDTQR
jgi:hypothetical protein